MFRRSIPLMLLLATSSFMTPPLALAADTSFCKPPLGWVDVSPPNVNTTERLVSRTETITIDRSLDVVMKEVNKPLNEVVRPTTSLPGVAGDYPLSPGGFGRPGSRRLVCLTDGSTTEEQSLESEVGATSYHFRYQVWNYTTEKARPIRYAVGDFHFAAIASDRTRIVWTYSFALDPQRFPGYLGAVGNFLFRVTFLDRQYAELMRNTLAGYNTAAEGDKVASGAPR